MVLYQGRAYVMLMTIVLLVTAHVASSAFVGLQIGGLMQKATMNGWIPPVCHQHVIIVHGIDASLCCVAV